MLQLDGIILAKLTEKDADNFFKLYKNREVNGGDEPFLQGEQALDFTRRIISLCNAIYSIRLAGNPDLIIGDCALHHWDPERKEIEVGGSLYPQYWGKGYMQSAFTLLEKIAEEEFRVEKIIGRTRSDNKKAIRLVQKMGFIKLLEEDTEVVLCKKIIHHI